MSEYLWTRGSVMYRAYCLARYKGKLITETSGWYTRDPYSMLRYAAFDLKRAMPQNSLYKEHGVQMRYTADPMDRTPVTVMRQDRQKRHTSIKDISYRCSCSAPDGDQRVLRHSPDCSLALIEMLYMLKKYDGYTTSNNAYNCQGRVAQWLKDRQRPLDRDPVIMSPTAQAVASLARLAIYLQDLNRYEVDTDAADKYQPPD